MIGGIGGGAATLLRGNKKGDQKNKRWFLSCLSKDIRARRERERIKQYSIWFEEIDTARQLEYVKRRQRRNDYLSNRLSNIKYFKFLLIPAGIFFVVGASILLAVNLNSVSSNTIFTKEASTFNIIGGTLVGLGFLCFVIVEGCISHINFRIDDEKKESELAEIDAVKRLPQNFPVFVFANDKLPDPYNDLNKNRNPPKRTRSLDDAKNLGGARPKRAPKLAMLGKSNTNGYFALSVDSATSNIHKKLDSIGDGSIDIVCSSPVDESSVIINLDKERQEHSDSIKDLPDVSCTENVLGATCIEITESETVDTLGEYTAPGRRAMFERAASDDSLNTYDHFST